MTVLMLVFGLVILTAGAEILVRSASALALSFHVSPLVIGLTVVAFGTSAPELVVSIQASLMGEPDLALGNVIGSNILNVLLILGASALITPLVVSQQLVRFDVPLMIAMSVLMFVLGLDGRIARWEGAGLFLGLLAYISWGIRQSRRKQLAIAEEYLKEFGQAALRPTLANTALQILMLGGGLLMLVLGARWFSSASVAIARELGVSELVIGLTLVAVGTSLPEVATSIVAAIKGERDIAVGNVVGSNLFNIMGVLGLASAVSPRGIGVDEGALYFDIVVMIAVAVACLPIFFTGHVIARWEGGLFLAYYFAYTFYLFLDATEAAITRTFSMVMVGFAIPLTVITLAIGVWRALRDPARVS